MTITELFEKFSVEQIPRSTMDMLSRRIDLQRKWESSLESSSGIVKVEWRKRVNWLAKENETLKRECNTI